ncbi:MAG: PIN domain-containing protein [Pseudonocardia sp.]
MVVVDASVLVNALADDDLDGDRVRERLLAEADLHAPDLVDLEVLSVLRSGALDPEHLPPYLIVRTSFPSWSSHTVTNQNPGPDGVRPTRS